ncbi:hypothetical protein PSTG_01242, partial [Puccinia striiformis f. sp. tritici PST-78]
MSGAGPGVCTVAGKQVLIWLTTSAKAISDSIDIWLSGGLVLEDGAPVNGLKWWADQKRGGNTHHGLLQMALDVMCCP